MLDPISRFALGYQGLSRQQFLLAHHQLHSGKDHRVALDLSEGYRRARHRNCGASLPYWFREIFPMSIWNGARLTSSTTLFTAPLTDRQSSGENDVQTRPVKRASND
ncbi:hypothetical protein [Bradyrhizobium sp. USDA 3458]|uniref:hypothetical protein n=1 Tax=Bradyrhizobium sp. USDA 3458 TaxID=2591461 RepID=UPI00190F9CF2|nr:hypothetical protein [Bradyrhizobium sp. USDA 3458]